MKLVLFVAVGILAGCAPSGESPPPTGEWFNEPSHYPGICMTFSETGTLTFRGGFEFWNPARWFYDQEHQELAIYLGGTGALLIGPFTDQLQRQPDTLVRFNAKERQIVLPYPPKHGYLQLNGFNFYNEPCKDPQKPVATAPPAR